MGFGKRKSMVAVDFKTPDQPTPKRRSILKTGESQLLKVPEAFESTDFNTRKQFIALKDQLLDIYNPKNREMLLESQKLIKNHCENNI